MKLEEIKQYLAPEVLRVLSKDIETLTPAQEKAVKAGLFENKNLLVCTPTASGKTLIGEFAATTAIAQNRGKAIYIVPLKALANEKYKDFKKRYAGLFKIAISIGDTDSADTYLSNYDFIICTSEKLDSLIRHHTPWLKSVAVVIVDEIHLLNDAGRGPTLEILLTLLRKLLAKVQVIGLSATIGNAPELAHWLDANLIVDEWRPVKLHKGIYYDGEIEFKEE
ncbi:DEAD/DEAH box helicase [Candidatus Woesearchaeota archaeon]|nr:DEAD/DEAH box helicase [Candidatus Woesearchaeota archaeon]